MATMRTVLNRVLRTLGEEQVASSSSSITDDYHLLVAEFLNQFKEEIEDAHNWRALRSGLTVTITASASSGVVTGANERSRLVRDHNSSSGALYPLVFDLTDASNPIPLAEIDLAAMLIKQSVDPQTATEPSMFALDSNATDGVRMYVWPTPTIQRTISATMIVPQDYLEDDDLDTVIKVPTRPLLQGTIWFALHERGEELGQGTMFTEERYRTALDDAISRDVAESGDLELVVV